MENENFNRDFKNVLLEQFKLFFIIGGAQSEEDDFFYLPEFLEKQFFEENYSSICFIHFGKYIEPTLARRYTDMYNYLK